MPRIYSSNLSTKGFSSLINEIENYKKKLNEGTDKGLKELAKMGKDIAIKEGSQFSDNLVRNGVEYEKEAKNHYILKTTNPLLTLLECGTGIIGENSKSKTAELIGYQYRIGDKIRVYTLNFNGIPQQYEGWFYYDEKLGKIRFTQGIPSRPFFSNTALFLKRIAPKYVANSIRSEIK